MKKYFIKATLRKLGLIKFIDKTRFYIKFLQTKGLRKQFFKENPDVKIPPAYFVYETFGLNYFEFYHKSIDSAQWLVNFFEKYKELKNLNILDWGCGPGRLIRHLPSFLDETSQCYGTDYNKKYIDWCSENIQDISFNSNELAPPLRYESELFDVIYGISIFTHLSEKMHHAWFEELMRVLKPGGILLITLHGNAFEEKLIESERERFRKGELIEKSNTKEGHRTYAAFQPESFVLKMIGKNKVLEHVSGEIVNGKHQQDVWIIQKVK